MPAVLHLFRVVLLGLAFASCAAFAHADNWDRFRGPNGDGVSNDKMIPVKFSANDGVLWKTPIPGDGNGSPIVWGDRVFLQTASRDGSDRSLLCLDANTGKEVWKRSIPGTTAKIRSDSSLASATPTTDGEAVYVPFWNGKDILLCAYNFKGDKLWERNLGAFISQHGPGASPILFKDLLIFSMDKDAHFDVVKKNKLVPNPSTLYAFDKRTGKTVWETPREAFRACYTIPFIIERPGNSPELIVTSTTAITSYQPDTGTPSWHYNWTFPKDPMRTIAASMYVDGILMAFSGDGSGDRHMAAIQITGEGKETIAKKIWENNKQFPYVTCPLIKGEHVYFLNDLGLAGCYHIKTGKKVWFERVSRTVYASPILIDGKIYAPSDDGNVYVIAADPTFNLLATNKMGERIRATPAVANGRLYLRGQDHLFCIGNK